MSKKQENRKLILQNNRNRIINKRYISTIKTLSKLFQVRIKLFISENNTETKEKLKMESFSLVKSLYSIIDKAVKKKVIHKNTAARKKSRFGKLFAKI
jgi:small subunit ribosomal protein S20